VMHRPALLPIPKFGPSLLLGSELAQSLLYDSARVYPNALAASSFEWTMPTIDDALHHLLGHGDHQH
jgi:NAD dependent epimerase/dehydratase family enzyme